MKPWIHAQKSAKLFGGEPDEYMEIHNFMDSSKSALPTKFHRAFTHNAWFIGTVIERVFGSTITVGKGGNKKEVSVRDIAEQHVLDDFGGKFIPTMQDWADAMEFYGWMDNGAGLPPSVQDLPEKLKRSGIYATPERIEESIRQVLDENSEEDSLLEPEEPEESTEAPESNNRSRMRIRERRSTIIPSRRRRDIGRMVID